MVTFHLMTTTSWGASTHEVPRISSMGVDIIFSVRLVKVCYTCGLIPCLLNGIDGCEIISGFEDSTPRQVWFTNHIFASHVANGWTNKRYMFFPSNSPNLRGGPPPNSTTTHGTIVIHSLLRLTLRSPPLSTSSTILEGLIRV